MARIIVGTNGADTLQDHTGNISQLIGLGGDDTYLVDFNGPFTDTVVEAAGGGTDTVIFSYFNSGSSTDTLHYALSANVENFTANFYGGIYYAESNEAEDLGDGANLEFYGGSRVVVFGNTSNNVITGGNGNDVLHGVAGYGGVAGGKDTLIGGDGNDRYYVDSSDDVVIEQAHLVTFTTGYVGHHGAHVFYGGANATFDIGGEHDTVFSTAATYTLSANVENIILTYGGASLNINAIGNAGDNNMYGNTGNNNLSGLAGDDHLDGNQGNDKLSGGDGNDYLQGGRDNDTLDGGNGDDVLDGNGSPGVTSTDNDSLIGGAGNDRFYSMFDGFADTLVGGAGNDEYLVDGQDVITEAANGGIDSVTIFSDNDFSYTLAANVENATILNYGYNSVRNLTGNASDNILTGNHYNNVLMGLGGNDVMYGGGGNDSMFGGDGNDTYMVDSTSDTVTETNAAAAGGIDTVYSDVNFVLGNNVENLTLTSTKYGGNGVTGIGNALKNLIIGNENNNTLLGNAGDDTLDGGDGIDILNGGAGNDTYIVDNSFDRIIEIAEPVATNGTKDKIILTDDFSGTGYTIQVNVEQLDASATSGGVSLIGNNSNNIITGGTGNDVLDGRAGFDSMAGGAGDDTYFVNEGTGLNTITTGDVVTEGTNAGTDVVYASVVSGYTLGANIENLFLMSNSLNGTGNTLNNLIVGNAQNNILIGNAGDDTLVGGYGRDSLNGGAGNDTLDGGAGVDTLTGGAGNDLYIVTTGDVITGETGGVDTVRTNVNTYDLTNTALNGAGVTAIDNLIFTGSGVFVGTGNSLNNSIVGGASGGDSLIGGLGNDTLDSGLDGERDNLIGGKGDDAYIIDYNGGGDFVTENLNEGTDTIIFNFFAYSLDNNVEKLVLLEGSGAVQGFGNALANTITGNSADNLLDGGVGADSMTGGKGNDTYYVDNVGDKVTETDTAANGGGYDTVHSTVSFTLGANLESLYLDGGATGTGNALDNNIYGNASNNTLSGLDGNDYIVGNDGNDTLKGGNGDDDLFGGNDNDSLDGSNGNDYLDGGAGTDTMNGGAGDDFYRIDSATDVIIDASGNDTAVYDVSGTYVLTAGIENAAFYGGGGSTVTVHAGDNTNNNIILGNSGNDISTGGGNDTVFLTAHTGFVDTIDGGSGTDTLNVTFGSYGGSAPYGGTFISNAHTTSTLTGIENVVITVNGSFVNSGHRFYGGPAGDHSWSMDNYGGVAGGFNGTALAHNHITIDGGDFGGGAFELSGFGKNVDFTLQDYNRDPSLGGVYGGGIDLSGVIGGWNNGDTLNVTLDDFHGGLAAHNLGYNSGSLHLTSNGGNSVTNEVDMNTLYTYGGNINLTVTGDTGLTIDRAHDGAVIAVDDFTGQSLTINLDNGGGIFISDDITLNVDNSNTQINVNSGLETLNINSSGNNFLDLSNLNAGNTAVFATGTDGLLSIQSNGGILDASGFSASLVVDASAAGNALTVTGGSGDNMITGSVYGDIITGGAGGDWLTGNGGSDQFYFNDAPGSAVDLITDFAAGDDSIYLSPQFDLLGTMGTTLSASHFVSAPDVDEASLSTQAYILYDTNTGALYYDEDGSAIIGNAVQFAQLGLGSHPNITENDIHLM